MLGALEPLCSSQPPKVLDLLLHVARGASFAGRELHGTPQDGGAGLGVGCDLPSAGWQAVRG